MPKILIFLVSFLLSFEAVANEVSATIKSGDTVSLYSFTESDQSCNTVGTPKVYITEIPNHGDLHIESKEDIELYRPLKCEWKHFPGIVILYQSYKDYVGHDEINIKVIYSDNHEENHKIYLNIVD